MLKIYLALIILLVTSNVFSQDIKAILDSTKKLIQMTKFEEAHKLSFEAYDFVMKENLLKSEIGMRALSNLTSVYYNKRNFDSALYYQEIAYTIMKEEKSKKICEISQNIASIYSQIRNFEKAEFYYEESIKYSIEYENYPNLIWTYNQYGTMNFHMGRYDEASELYTKSYNLAKEKLDKNHDYYTQSLNSLAVYNYQFSNFKEAEKFFRELLSIYYSMEYIPQTKTLGSINGLAATLLELGNFKDAEENFLKSLKLTRELIKNDDQALATRIHNVGYFYHKKGDLKLAIKYYNEAYEMRIRLYKDADHTYMSNSLSGLGSVYMAIEDSAKTLFFFENDLAMNRRLAKNDNLNLLNALTSLGAFYRFHDKFDKAYPLFLEAKEMALRMNLSQHPNYANILVDMGILLLRDNKETDAQAYFDEALNINRKFYDKYSTKLSHNLYMSSHYYFTVKNYEKADSLISEALDYSNYILDNSVDFFTESEKESFLTVLDDISYLYFNLVSKNYLTNHKKTIGGFENRINRKGYLFNSTKKLADYMLNVSDSTIINTYKTWIDRKEEYAKLIGLSKNQIASRNVNIDEFLNEINLLEKDLINKVKGFEDFNSNKKVTFSEIKSKLNKGEAAVEILRILTHGKDNDSAFYMAMIVKNDSEFPEIVIIENGWDLEANFSKIYKQELINDDKNKNSYKNYWVEIAKKLNGINKIYFSPDGIYHQINIAALKNPKNGKYLEEELDIVILSNIKDLLKSEENYHNYPYVALFGNPDFDYNFNKAIEKNLIATTNDLIIYRNIDSLERSGINLVPLPSTQSEVNEIKSLFDKEKISATIYSGMDANEYKLKNLESPTVLHLATHGFFLKDAQIKHNSDFDNSITENPLMRSMLFLAGSKHSLNNNDSLNLINMEEDGILTAYEAQNLNLQNTEMVVLAACETGLGEIKNGEGVYGLQRAFLQAGAKSVMMSLWKINDKATKDMMLSFYKNWLSGKTRNEAFRLAKKEIKKKYKYPYYWASFVLIGD